MTDVYKKTLTQIRDTSIKPLSELTDRAIGHTLLEIHQQLQNREDEDKLRTARARVVERFKNYVLTDFNDLMDEGQLKKHRIPKIRNLSLIDNRILDAYVALEGMAKHARNSEVNEYLRFTIRINAQFYNARLSESNNPLDPGRLAEGFKYAVMPVCLSGPAMRMLYRQFNTHVFHHMGEVMRDANDLLKKTGIAPNLENLGRTRKSLVNRLSERRRKPDARPASKRKAGASNPAVATGKTRKLLLLRELLQNRQAESCGDTAEIRFKSGRHSASADAHPEKLDRNQLLQLLYEYRNESGQSIEADDPATMFSATNFLHRLLEQSSDTGSARIPDDESADLVQLVDLLYAEILKDKCLASGPADLISQTHATALQVALADPAFFDDADHPLRTLLNELAAAGIGWTEADSLDDDPVYACASKSIKSMVSDYDGDPELVESLLEELLEFKEQRQNKESEFRKRMIGGGKSRDRMDEIRNYANRAVSERILDPDTPAQVRELLETHYRNFLVNVILREGPGGDGWKRAMETVEVLLWSVSPRKTKEDMDRIELVNETLMSNLTRSLQVTGVAKAESEKLLNQLLKLQQEHLSADLDSFTSEFKKQGKPRGDDKQDHEPVDEELLLVVRKLTTGMWFEFKSRDTGMIRCRLATIIPSIDRYVFFNWRGIKIIERSATELVRDIQAKQARLINDCNLMDRAMDAVVKSLGGSGARTRSAAAA